MKTQKLTFTTLSIALLMASIGGTKAYTIDSLKIIPANPTTDDIIKVISYTTFSSGECQLTDSSISIVGSTIAINAAHTVGMLTVMCSSIDTLTIGTLNSGTYTLIYYLSDTIPATVIYDTATITFTVQSTTGLQNIDPSSLKIKIYPNPNKGLLTIEGESLSGSQIKVYTPYGQMVFSSKVQSDKEQLNLSHLLSGVYSIEVVHKNGKTRKQVVISN